MNTTAIKIAVERIAEYELALGWLEQYGTSLSGRDKDGFGLSFHPGFASACVGAKEAKAVIDAFARHHIEAIVKDAIANCRNTMAIDRETIIREAQS